MGDWWTVIALFWLLFLTEGLWVLRSPHQHFTAWLPGKGAWTHSLWRWLPPLPWTWRLQAQDNDLSLSPEGVCNLGAGHAARPTPMPPRSKAFRWEEIRTVSGDGKRIRINGEDFCAETPLCDARRLAGLAQQVPKLPPKEREALLDALTRSWYSTTRARRRHRVFLGATQGLVWLNTMLLVVLVCLSMQVVFSDAEILPEAWVRRLNQSLPMLLGWAVAVHGAAIIQAILITKRLKRQCKSPEIGDWVGAALLPAHALRLRAFCLGRRKEALHPLALAIALGTRGGVRELADRVLSDLRWPLPDRQGQDSLASGIRAWHAALQLGIAMECLRANGLEKLCLTPTPRPHGREACCYCPRCGDQFNSPDGGCPWGVPAKRFGEVARSGTRKRFESE